MLNFDYIVGLVDGEGSFTAYVRFPELKKEAKNALELVACGKSAGAMGT